MKLKVNKIKRELRRLEWSYDRLAKEAGLKSRQIVFYYLKTGCISGVAKIAKALDVDARDLIDI